MFKVFSHVSANNIKLERMPFPSELAMEGYIYENPEVLRLNDDVDVAIWQLEKPWGKGGTGKGRIDIFASYGSTLAVVELKNGALTRDHFNQLNDYFGDESNLDVVKHGFPVMDGQNGGPEWVGVLVGTDIASSLESDLVNNAIKLQGKYSMLALVLNRYRVGKDVFVFSNIITSKKSNDLTKYRFENKDYAKNRLLLAFVKKYVEDHPDVTIDKLKSKIESVKGAGKVLLKDFDEARTLFDQGKNYYNVRSDDDVVRLQDGSRWAVGNTWSVGYIPVAKAIGKVLGYECKEVKPKKD